jgi:hypothetical protein
MGNVNSFNNIAAEQQADHEKEYFIQIIDISDKMMYSDAMAEQ